MRDRMRRAAAGSLRLWRLDIDMLGRSRCEIETGDDTTYVADAVFALIMGFNYGMTPDMVIGPMGVVA